MLQIENEDFNYLYMADSLIYNIAIYQQNKK